MSINRGSGSVYCSYFKDYYKVIKPGRVLYQLTQRDSYWSLANKIPTRIKTNKKLAYSHLFMEIFKRS